MGPSEGARHIGRGQTFNCMFCGLPQERVRTLDNDWRLMEPDMTPLAHTVPAEHRWIVLSDGRVTVYGVSPPDMQQRCRIEHALACPTQPLPDLWPWLTALREENEREARRGREAPGEVDPGWPEVG
ncbi:DUF6083 domain-containing protein [Streptomyces sp. NPDC047123]|uniref:DUF6083 domain-containing protein n=1 Tax=Streptomyces sp. NPDC047123 TaxID=3155622 RepID=UPI0033CD9750